MKKFRIVLGVILTIVLAACGTAIGLSVWANKPRGIRIDLDSIKE